VRAGGGYLLRRVRVFWLVVVFELPVGGHETHPAYASAMAPSTPHLRERRRWRQPRAHFRLVGGHRGVSVRRLEQGAPRRIPCPHRLPEHAAAARRVYQQLGREGLTAGNGLVEGGAEVAIAGVPCQQVRHAASAAAAAGRADPPPPATAVGVDPDAVVVVVVRPPGDAHPYRGHKRSDDVFLAGVVRWRENGEKVDLAEKKIWRRWPANAARFFEIWRAEKKIWRRWPANAARFFEIWWKSQSGGALHKSGLAKLIR